MEISYQLSGVPARFHICYELNRDKVDSYVLKYGIKGCKSVIHNYFEFTLQIHNNIGYV